MVLKMEDEFVDDTMIDSSSRPGWVARKYWSAASKEGVCSCLLYSFRRTNSVRLMSMEASRQSRRDMPAHELRERHRSLDQSIWTGCGGCIAEAWLL